MYSFTDDPEMLVRNDVSRFMLHWIGSMPDSSDKLQKSLVDALVLQMKRPSHADRNKALVCLLDFVKNNPTARSYLKDIGSAEIEHLAKSSVLENVGGVAKELLKLIQ